MTVTPSEDDDDTTIREGLPERTTPTWEVELLISGVAVFAMLQLPGWFDDRFFELVPRFGLDGAFTLFYGYVYAKGGALILAATFVLHLLLRAHWIALVGVDSIYPGGIRWDRLRMGPIQRDVVRAGMGTVADAIERADNRATLVFAAGVYLALQMVKMFILVVLCAVVGFAASLVAPVSMRVLLAWSVVVVIVPMALLWRVDKIFGARLATDGLAARVMRAGFRFYGAIGFGRGAAPGVMLMSSHAGSRRVFASVFAITLGAIAVIMAGVQVGRDPDRMGDFGFLAEEVPGGSGTLLRQHYDDQRSAERPGSLPFVQSQVISEPYLRLAIPIRPALHDAVLRRCRSASTGTQDQRTAAQVACLSAAHPLQLDGRALVTRFDFGADPRARVPALIAMIDVRSLASGRHELVVGEPPDPDGSPVPADRIPFWR